MPEKVTIANNDTIDLFKFFGSIFLFLMHLSIFADSEKFQFTWELFSRWAVPFFFIASSFFLFRKEVNGNINRQTLLRYVKRIAILYLAWFLFNIPSTFWLRLRPGTGNLQTWLIFFKNTLLSSSFLGSWYLLSSIFSAVVLYLLSINHSTRTCLLLTATAYVISLLTSCYGGLLPQSIAKVTSWLCFPLNIFGGLLFFAIGKWLYECQEMLLKHNSLIFLLLVLVSFAMYVTETTFSERWGVFRSTDFAIGTVPLAASLFLFCLKSSYSIPYSIILRKSSTVIYCAQGNIICAAAMAAKCIGITSNLLRGVIGIAFMALLIALILYAQKRQCPKWAKHLT